MSARRPYEGSCHCGTVRYIVYLHLPPTIQPTRSGVPRWTTSSASDTGNTKETGSEGEVTTRIRKCNCQTCQKMGLFHVRVQNGREDFVVLSPVSEEDGGGVKGGLVVGENGLKDYVCPGGQIHWYFCGTCGVRCFSFMGEGEVRDVLVKEETKRGWTPEEGFFEGGVKKGPSFKNGYVSINAITLDAGQEGLDLREWHEKGWISYLDCLYEKGEDRLITPHEGGMY